LIEAIASDPDIPMRETGLDTPGYRSLWVADLMVDYDPRTGKPYAFMSSSFEKTYPLVIWALKFHMDDELFDVPQANLTAVHLHEAFSWAYCPLYPGRSVVHPPTGGAVRTAQPDSPSGALRRCRRVKPHPDHFRITSKNEPLVGSFSLKGLLRITGGELAKSQPERDHRQGHSVPSCISLGPESLTRRIANHRSLAASTGWCWNHYRRRHGCSISP